MRRATALSMALLVILTLLAAGIGGVLATFSDGETSIGNRLETPGLDLKVNARDDQPWGSGLGAVIQIAEGALATSYSREVQLWNTGEVAGLAYMQVSDLDDPSGLAHRTTAEIRVGDQLAQTGLISQLSGIPIEIGDLPAGGAKHVRITLCASDGTQGERLDFNLEFSLVGPWIDTEMSTGNYFQLA